jgi:cell division initiation protein
MPIRPIDVRRKEFRNSLRGYDANQVDDFLDAVADEFERAYTDNARMREEISSLRERLQQFEELEGSIRAALVHAEQAADDLRHSATREAEDLRASATREAEDLRTSATREADFTIREAKARAHQMLAESSARVERIQESYEALQEAKRNFANDFRHLLKTYLDMMENMEIASAKEIETSLRQRLDTESIAIAREAATYAKESVEQTPAEPEVGEETAPTFEEEAPAAEDTGATQPIERAEVAGEEPPQVEEQGVVEQPQTEPFTPQEESFVSNQEPDVRPDAEAEAVVEESVRSEESAVAEEPPPPKEPAATEDAAAVADQGSPAAEEVEREEPTLVEESSSQSFSDREEAGRSSEEGERDNRIFRASRFLRRRE